MNITNDPILGPYEEIITARAVDKKVLKKSQDGGIVSTLLSFALEDGIIDGTIVAAPSDNPWKPEPLIATTKKEILKGAGTKYTMCPNVALLKEATREYGLEKIGTIGTPCQIMGIRKLQSYPMGFRNVSENIALILGIYCMENFPYESIRTFVEDTVGVPLSKVTKLDISKGKLFITHTDGEGSIPLKKTHGFEQTGCNYCLDYLGELSDASCGSVGAKPGWSTIFKRTNKGKTLVDRAIEEGEIEVTETNPGKFGIEMLEKLSKQKKTKNQKKIDKKLDLGLNIPFKHSRDKTDIYENR